MPIDPELRSLEIDVPSRPESIVKLTLLMAEPLANLTGLAELIEGDMALASAVLRAVNSSLYGLSGRVQSVQQAITYLGSREVAGITLEMGLRAVFPAAVELEPIWRRAAQRGLLMGRLGQAIDVDAWAAHSAGLFEECGKAVLFRHTPEHYRALLRAAANDTALCELEVTDFGVSHDALGAALCESWGLHAAAVVSVRHHVAAQADGLLPQSLSRRAVLALSVLAHTMMNAPSTLESVAERVAPQADLDTLLVLRAVRAVSARADSAAAHGL
jgi:HD-like signal output (HDOD) protein